MLLMKTSGNLNINFIITAVIVIGKFVMMWFTVKPNNNSLKQFKKIMTYCVLLESSLF